MNAPYQKKLLKSSEVMTYFGYSNRSSFWEFVRKHGVPHIRLNPRRIMFDGEVLEGWINRRSSAVRR